MKIKISADPAGFELRQLGKTHWLKLKREMLDPGGLKANKSLEKGES